MPSILLAAYIFIILYFILKALDAGFTNYIQVYKYQYNPSFEEYNSYYDKLNDKNIDNSTTISNVVVLFSYDYDKIPEYKQYTTDIAKLYCEIYGYIIEDINHYQDQDKVSPYWIRVKDLIDLSKKYDSNTVFLYMDIDATINPEHFSTSIIDLLNIIDNYHDKSYNMYIGRDISNEFEVNTGVMILRNTDWTKQLLQTWWSKYNPDNWYIENGKWKCTIDGSKCPWANTGYEQGAFGRMYKSNSMRLRSNLLVLNMQIVSNPVPNNNNFIIHLLNGGDYRRLRIFKSLYNNLLNN